MTVAVAWVRTVGKYEELMFVTDSRLSGDGRAFDACPKIVALPRGDCAIAFAGYTGDAYPMMQQLVSAIQAHAPLMRRALDLTALVKHMIQIFNEMSDLISVEKGMAKLVPTAPNVEFLFGGYCWKKKTFRLWSIRYAPEGREADAHRSSTGTFQAHPANMWRVDPNGRRVVGRKGDADITKLGLVAFAGDQRKAAKNGLEAELQKHPRNIGQPFGLEPFEVVRDMLRSKSRADTIGGAPQVVKITQYADASKVGVYWPSKSEGRIHLLGRPCLRYERIDHAVLDPDTLKLGSPPAPTTEIGANDPNGEIAAED